MENLASTAADLSIADVLENQVCLQNLSYVWKERHLPALYPGFCTLTISLGVSGHQAAWGV
jgi:hypothetical protein